MSGIFCKDIWGIIYGKLEISYDPISLNNLSITCKKLHNIDMERRKNYIRQYEKHGPLIEKLKKGRQNYINLIKYAPLSCYIYPHQYFKIDFQTVCTWLTIAGYGPITDEAQTISHLMTLLNVKKLAEYYTNKDLELIRAQVCASDLQYMFSYIKSNGDIINTIMELQFM